MATFTVTTAENDSCIKICRDESHFNVFTVRDSHKTVHRPQLLKRKESQSRFKPRSLCLPALLLGQTGSCQMQVIDFLIFFFIWLVSF